MKDGFARVAAAVPKLKVADPEYNVKEIEKLIRKAAKNNAAAVIFPELAITAYTCGDLFKDRTLMTAAQDCLKTLIENTADLDILCAVGMPVPYLGALYNCIAVFKDGELLGLPAKKNIPNYSEFYEMRHFTPASGTEIIDFCGFEVPMGEDIIFTSVTYPDLSFGFEVCEDVWIASPPSAKLARNGALIIMNSSCSDEIIGKSDYRRMMLKAYSGRILSAYVYTDSGIGESTTDMVFAGHRLICENGSLITESPLFKDGISYGDIDCQRLVQERRRMNTWTDSKDDVSIVSFDYDEDSFKDYEPKREIPSHPFVPSDSRDLGERCRAILDMQSVGLMTRLRHIGSKTAVIGLSGGLDSTLALLVTVRAFDALKLDKKGIKTISMPCFGTTKRTKSNAESLAGELGVSFKEIPITAAVNQHFKDIGQNSDTLDVTYENSQARERTQVLMDIANKENGIVIGTGDLSELALGWATYNGDHMSMYAVNASIPKTLVRHLVKYAADSGSKKIKTVLYDILDTPVSPELLPPKDGEISQKTEDLVGPYELHDFFLYYMLRFGFTPEKIYHMALYSFDGVYEADEIKKWLRIFYRRFFTQQFKRSCLPDGPKVGSVTLSPRGDFRMPSDASFNIWLKAVDEL